MNNKFVPAPSPIRPMSRDLLVSLLKAALLVGERKYARRIALAWLASFPGDLEVSFLHAQALLQEDNPLSLKQALHILEELCASDPEYSEAQMSLTQARRAAGLEDLQDSFGYEIVLSSKPDQRLRESSGKIPKWAISLREAQEKIINKNSPDEVTFKEIKNQIHQALSQSSNNLLVAVTHFRVMRKDESLSELGLRSLAEAYHNRWPNCIQFMLYLADLFMLSGDSDLAVTLLHRAVSADITGQVALRQWGESHPYRALWPANIEIADSGINTPQSIPIPASVASVLGWNQLPDSTRMPLSSSNTDEGNYIFSGNKTETPITIDNLSETSSQASLYKEQTRDDLLKDSWGDFHKLASKLKQPELSKMDGRFPVYVVMTTKTGLRLKYGQEYANTINEELKKLVAVIRGSQIGHRTWGSMLFYPDEAENINHYDIKPVPHNDPWGIKLTLADLETYLEKRGEMIGAVLIVGCQNVVPFHYLPNPVDDDDADVASDNPYATSDSNYFVQEWPIGRLPGDNGKDPRFLLSCITSIISHYQELKHARPWYQRLLDMVIDLIWPPYKKVQPSLGYSAAVWRRASFSVFRTIGQPKSLYISPPTISCDIKSNTNGFKDTKYNSSCISLGPSYLAYFNLHGLQDSAEWYGQSDPTETDNQPDFPVALRPQDVVDGGRAPKIVFSEACYGAHISDKRLDEALALKFLASGSRCVVGSSCISYGSIRTPLIGADLLGHAFWKYLVEGMTVGEALRRAKIYLISEMNKRQGYLDGEDQKTLISFVLYGDPLAQIFEEKHKSKLMMRSYSHNEIRTSCARVDASADSQYVPPEIMTNVKHVVSHYLPGMQDANVSMGFERTGCQNACRNCLSGNLCPTAKSDHRNIAGKVPERRVITLSKSIRQADFDHKQFAHITLDSQGKVIKLAVSR